MADTKPDAKKSDDNIPSYGAEFWHQEIEREGKRGGNKWRKRAKTTVDRYRDERGTETGEGGKVEQHAKRFNIFYSNVETLKPAISARTPVPAVARRFKGEDEPTRLAGEIIQTALSFALDDYDFDVEKDRARDDGLIAGRGVLRVEYKAKIVRRTPKLAPSPLPGAAAPPALAPAGFPGPGAGGAPPMPGMAPPMGLLGAAGIGPPAAPGGAGMGMAPGGAPMLPPPPGNAPGGPPGGMAMPPMAQALLQAGPPPAGSGDVSRETMPGAVTPSGAPGTEDKPRYEIDGLEVEPDGEDDDGNPYVEEVVEETVRAWHVLWRDFRHTPVNDWRRVWWVAFARYPTRYEAEKEYGPRIADRLSYKPADDTDEDKPDGQFREADRALVWEIWCKRTKKVHHVADTIRDEVIKEEPVPFDVDDFFPVAPPWRPIGTTDRWEPIPEYCIYQDQAEEIDAYTDRITALTQAIEAKGAAPGPIAGALKDIKNMPDGHVGPVEDWESLAEHGGFENSIAWMPIKQMADVVKILSERRMQSKQELYEITGISDLMRQATVASETATAQQLKGNFGNMRLQPRQLPFERFVRDTLRLMAQVMASKFSPRTLERMTGVPLAAMNPQRRPDADQIIELLRDKELRAYRIDVETDSMIQPDEQQEKANVVEFVGAIAKYLESAVTVGGADPLLMPLLMEMLKSACRRFKLGRELEDTIQQVVESHTKAAEVKAQQPPPKDPALVEAEAKMALEQQKMKMEAEERQAKAQADAAEKQAKAQAEAEQRMADQAHEAARLQQEQMAAAAKSEMERQAHEAEMRRLDEKHAADMREREVKLEMELRDIGLRENEDRRKDDDHRAKMRDGERKEEAHAADMGKRNADRAGAESNAAQQGQFVEMLGKLTELIEKMKQPRAMTGKRGADGTWMIGEVTAPKGKAN